MSKRKYYGWIYRESSPGFKDYFSTQNKDESGNTITHAFGYGRAAEAVAYFEEATTRDENGLVKGMSLGPVQLEVTPIGLRVFRFID